MVGRTLAHYRILEQIGAGGMGVVYRARDMELERDVAVKVVGEGSDELARQRLRREARTASALNHPNICTIYEVGEAEGQTYIAMELVEGRPLSALIGSDGLPVETAIRYGAQIADALAHAHERGVVHRDLKCANAIVTPEGRPKVLDFGLAKRVVEETEATRTEEPLTEAGTVAGTLSYMAPEVLRGEPADPRSDLWALGVMLYQAVSGTLPFRGSTAFEITSAILRDSAAPLPASVPLGLAAILQRLLAKQPGERYQRAGEVRAALEAIQPAVSTSGAVPVVAVSRRKWIWVAGAVAVAGVVVWLGIHWPSSGPRLSDGARPSSIPEANEYYERGLTFAGTGPRHDRAQMLRMFGRALAIDPRFAAARAGLAFAQMMAIYQGDSNDPGLLYKAEEEARRALQDDPGCGGAHTVLAGTYLLQGRRELVAGEVALALQENPNDLPALNWVPLYHRANGDYERAVRESRQVIARQPLFWPAHLNLAEMLGEQGDTAGAIRELERILESDPASRVALWTLARVHMDAGDLPKARQAMQRVDPQHRRNFRGRLRWALLLALEGKGAEARREMDQPLHDFAAMVYLGALWVAEYYAVLGETDKALEWTDRAARSADDREDWFRRDPHLASIRDHPRFQQVVASVAYRRQQRSQPVR
jgi:tetratricopeptide (TPR) repeat protein/predicted Ser/Thr protein kinase